MKSRLRAAMLLCALAALTGCTTSALKPPSAEAKAPSVETTAAVPTDFAVEEEKVAPASAADEEACKTAVATTTGDSDMEILNSNAADGNPVIVVGVGPQKARWQCLMAGGKVAGITAVTAEVEF
ncbi:MAG: hypothetical protein IPL47_05180 [Phyllobacteriaceae bacterium]|nr:hypothetical protein [Phyllobacteriaceae bacterium]